LKGKLKKRIRDLERSRTFDRSQAQFVLAAGNEDSLHLYSELVSIIEQQEHRLTTVRHETIQPQRHTDDPSPRSESTRNDSIRDSVTTSTDLKFGKDVQTIVDNTLSLMRTGHAKGEAMAHALNFAGYKPPQQSKE
jgi:hypothetical protein